MHADTQKLLCLLYVKAEGREWTSFGLPDVASELGWSGKKLNEEVALLVENELATRTAFFVGLTPEGAQQGRVLCEQE